MSFLHAIESVKLPVLDLDPLLCSAAKALRSGLCVGLHQFEPSHSADQHQKAGCDEKPSLYDVHVTPPPSRERR
jgi:hypothetical protein